MLQTLYNPSVANGIAHYCVYGAHTVSDAIFIEYVSDLSENYRRYYGL